MTNKTGHHIRQFHLALWPSETIALFRIPALIAGVIGLLGALKYDIDRVDILLRQMNLPPVDICWLLIILSAVVYAINLGYWIWSRKYRRNTGQAVSSTRWRTL